MLHLTALIVGFVILVSPRHAKKISPILPFVLCAAYAFGNAEALTECGGVWGYTNPACYLLKWLGTEAVPGDLFEKAVAAIAVGVFGQLVFTYFLKKIVLWVMTDAIVALGGPLTRSRLGALPTVNS